MKKSLKLISVLLVFAIMTTFTAISGSALATELVAGNTKETATNIPAYNVTYVSSLTKNAETDWLKFTTLAEDAYYTIYLENYSISEGTSWSDSDNLLLYAYDVYNRQIAYFASTGNANIKLERSTTYYIKVNMGSDRPSATGNYAIKIAYQLDPVPNTQSEATTISINTLFKRSLDGTGDYDWYKFTAPIAGKYKVTLENYNISEGTNWSDSDNLHLHAFDVYNKTLISQISAGTQETTLEAGETYYIRVNMGSDRNYATGNYGIKVQCDGYTGTPDPTPTPNPNPNPDPNPTPNPNPDVPAAKRLTRINIDTLPTKTTYAIGENFSTTGMFVSAKYADGSSKRIYDYIISGFDSSAEGVSVVTISYTEGGITMTATISCTIVTAIEDGENDDDGGFSIDSIFNFFTLLINLIYKAAEWLIDIFSNL